MSIETFLEWLGSTRWSVALLESVYAWSFVESAHVLTLGLFVGTAAMNDLRLLGLTLKRVPVADVTGRLLRWTRAAFALMVITGLLIFYSNPVHYYHNVFFRIKVLLLIAAGLNAWLFHGRIHKRVGQWQHDVRTPRSARMAGALSLLIWGAVVVSGRLIAYNWFDCELQPQPAFINWAADCSVGSD